MRIGVAKAVMEYSFQHQLMSRTMGLIDRVFVVVFARYRRKTGDSDLESAWRTASFRVSGYLVLPIAALTVLSTLAIYSLKRLGEPIDRQGTLLTQVAAVVIGLLVTVLLDKRFKKYLLNLPELSTDESRAEKLLIVKFRVIAVGIFSLVCAICFLWFKSGKDL